jgi:hypothetical protein
MGPIAAFGAFVIGMVVLIVRFGVAEARFSNAITERALEPEFPAAPSLRGALRAVDADVARRDQLIRDIDDRKIDDERLRVLLGERRNRLREFVVGAASLLLLLIIWMFALRNDSQAREPVAVAAVFVALMGALGVVIGYQLVVAIRARRTGASVGMATGLLVVLVTIALFVSRGFDAT